ncbi:DUF4097 family beta strand repeat-containing protein [Luteipulveratus mongoliensis]|uniref:DUF4097 domain-containing protein n=1 Tax=Luteipulveratus mongoliensis TaxID=571913 RepID=A0A0K1JLG7_9MICO|nr:DUF4097 family beta strand repeat-containing protein [Luteipulveratus mongoliensis]AKU17562.1 hypothetical protein VV02_19780 [Luteipulveratus mongoliensis]
MSEKWEIDGPRVMDIGGEHERVRALTIGMIGGHVDVVTHDDSPTARIEVHDVVGQPLKVSWDGRKVKILHVKTEGSNLWETLKGLGKGFQRQKAWISVSIPRDATASVSTVSADAVVSGIHAPTKINTVSGEVTTDDLVGTVDVNTVSGVIEAHGLQGQLKATTVSGGITVHDSSLDPIKLNSVSGDITLDLNNGRTTIGSNSVSGDVTVRVPVNGGYDVTVSTMSGAAIVDGRELNDGSGRRGGTLREGNGALSLKATSVSGDVVILSAPQDSPAPQDEPQDTPEGSV